MINFTTLKSAYAGTLVLCEDPMIAIADTFLSENECDRIIELAKGKLKRAKVSLDDKSEIIPGRSGENCWLRYSEDEIIKNIGDRIARFVNIPLEHAEALQVVHYDASQEYRAHYDAYDLRTSRGMRCCKYGGQRLLTALIYLNEVQEGGGTAFPKCKLTVAPRPGRMVVFHNVAGDITRPHPNSLHAGTAVLKGEKWAFNIWFHARPIREAQDFRKYSWGPAVRSDVPVEEGANPGPLQQPLPPIILRANRAVRLFENALSGLYFAPSHDREQIWFTYWDTYGGNFMDRSEIPTHARVIELVPRLKANPIANKGSLARMLRHNGLDDLAPATYESLEEAFENNTCEGAIWFLKPIFGTGGKAMRCVAHKDLLTEKLPSNFIVQAAVPNLLLQEGRKFTTRVYVLIWNGKVYLFENGFTIVHGQQYDPESTDYAIQIDHSGYTKKDSLIQMKPLAEYEGYTKVFPRLRGLIQDLNPIFTEVLDASDRDHYLVLGIDVLLQNDGSTKLVEINTFPNFIHTEKINKNVNIPLFQAVIRTTLGMRDDRFETLDGKHAVRGH